MADLNETAKVGFSKSSAYDSHRPSYSASIVQFLLEQLQVAGKKHAKILDLAAGTGKFTEALAAREEEYEIIAVEPHEQMRGTLDQKGLRGVKVAAGSAESIPLKDEEVDAVICAQVGEFPLLVSYTCLHISMDSIAGDEDAS